MCFSKTARSPLVPRSRCGFELGENQDELGENQDELGENQDELGV